MSSQLRRGDFISQRFVSKAGLECLLNTQDFAGIQLIVVFSLPPADKQTAYFKKEI